MRELPVKSNLSIWLHLCDFWPYFTSSYNPIYNQLFLWCLPKDRSSVCRNSFL